MKIIDTHQHLIYPDRFAYPWTGAVPELQGAFTLGDYWTAEAESGIAGTIFMEVDVPEEQQGREARFFCSLAEDPAHRLLGVIASARPEKDGFADYLDSIAHPKLKGLRRILHVVDDGISQSSLFAENVALLGERGLSFDLCVRANQLPLAIALADKCSGTQFILDHCGVPEVKGRTLDPWRERLRELAQLPNVACKVSGIVAYADPAGWTADDLRPYVDHVLASFGSERVVFGTDWPVCNLAANLKRWVETALELTLDAPAADRERLFSKNAERLYRL